MKNKFYLEHKKFEKLLKQNKKTIKRILNQCTNLAKEA